MRSQTSTEDVEAGWASNVDWLCHVSAASIRSQLCSPHSWALQKMAELTEMPFQGW